MRMSTLAFVCAVLLAACAFGESSGGSADAPSNQQAVCGDGTCSPEEVGKCAQDCGSTTGPKCGDGRCDAPGETNANCSQDCPPTGPVCGDGTCDMAGGETPATCPGDCQGGGGTLDCNDQNVLVQCTACLLFMQCADPITPENCQTCLGGP